MIKNCLMSQDLIAIGNILRMSNELLNAVKDKSEKEHDTDTFDKMTKMCDDCEHVLALYTNMMVSLVDENGYNSSAFTVVPVTQEEFLSFMLSELFSDAEESDEIEQ